MGGGGEYVNKVNGENLQLIKGMKGRKVFLTEDQIINFCVFEKNQSINMIKNRSVRKI